MRGEPTYVTKDALDYALVSTAGAFSCLCLGLQADWNTTKAAIVLFMLLAFNVLFRKALAWFNRDDAPAAPRVEPDRREG